MPSLANRSLRQRKRHGRSRGLPWHQGGNIKPQVDLFVFLDGHGVTVLASGRLLYLGCATGHPSFVLSCSFINQVLAHLDLLRNWKETKASNNDVYFAQRARREGRQPASSRSGCSARSASSLWRSSPARCPLHGFALCMALPAAWRCPLHGVAICMALPSAWRCPLHGVNMVTSHRCVWASRSRS